MKLRILFVKTCQTLATVVASLRREPNMASQCPRCESGILDRRRMMIVARYSVDLAPQTDTWKCPAHRV